MRRVGGWIGSVLICASLCACGSPTTAFAPSPTADPHTAPTAAQATPAQTEPVTSTAVVPRATSTVASEPTDQVTATPTQPSTAPVTDTPVVTPTEQPFGPTITLSDTGKTVTLTLGERFVLQLGDTFIWSVSIDNPTIISRVPGVLPIRGSQGLFETLKPGQTMLHATGDPACRQAKPQCELPSQLFQVTVVVQ